MPEPMPGVTGPTNKGAAIAGSNTPAVGGKQQGNSNSFAAAPKNSNTNAPRAMVNLEVRRPPVEKTDRSQYVSLKKIVDRTAQDAWNRLSEIVEKVAEADGKGKTLLADYAETYRRIFIKLLVITIWAANADKVGEIIDLTWYLRQMNEAYRVMPHAFLTIHNNMITAKVPNPDLQTAMEVLSTGHPRIPIMQHFIPPPPLSNQDILKTFREINAHLAIRMGLHETIPKHFGDYRIASGRVTFTVPGEFEVDVSVGDEKPESQLYLIDVRPLYTPSVTPLPKSIFDLLERRANHVLATEKLEGLYKFLHNFFETAKVTELHRQAAEMARGRWNEHLRIKVIRRTLTVEYWIQRPAAGRSYIEVGPKRQPNGSTKLGVRWLREGQEVIDEQITVDDTNLSMENLMKSVIVRHILFTLRSIKDQLASMMGSRLAKQTIRLNKHRTDPWKTHLALDFSSSLKPLVRIEPVTGRFSIAGAAQPQTGTVEERINRDPKTAAAMLQTLRMTMALAEVDQRARYMGWETFRKLQIDPRSFQMSVGANVKGQLFMRRNGWHKDWWVVYVQYEGGDGWWVLEMRPEVNVPESNGRLKVTKGTKIPITTSDGKSTDPTYEFFGQLEKIAAMLICSWVNSDDLKLRGTRYAFKPPSTTSSSNTPAYASSVRIPDLWVRLGDLIPASDWAYDVLKIIYQGISSTDGTPMVTLLVNGRSKERMTQLANTNLASTGAFEDVSFHPQTGSFIMRLRVRVGDSAIGLIRDKLRRISTVITFVTVIRQFGLNCTEVQLNRISFVYRSATSAHPTPQTAEIRFEKNSDVMHLKLPPDSPLLRVHPHLQYVLNSHGLSTVIKSLLVTAPLLTALDNLNLDDQTHILVRSLDWIRIEYRKTNNVVDFRLRKRKGELVWYVFDPLAGGVATAGNEERVKCDALKVVWEEEKESGWVGLRTGAAAGLDKVGMLVERVHTTVMGVGGQQ